MKVGDLVKIVETRRGDHPRRLHDKTGIIVAGAFDNEVIVLIDYLGKGQLEKIWFDCWDLKVLSENR